MAYLARSEYNLGQSIIFNIYLTNNHPYKVKVTLPRAHLTHYQVSMNHMGSVVEIKEIEDVNQTVIIDQYTDHYLAIFTYGPQRRIGRFEIHVGYEKLQIIIYVKINETSPTDVSVNSTGALSFLDDNNDAINSDIREWVTGVLYHKKKDNRIIHV